MSSAVVVVSFFFGSPFRQPLRPQDSLEWLLVRSRVKEKIVKNGGEKKKNSRDESTQEGRKRIKRRTWPCFETNRAAALTDEMNRPAALRDEMIN